MAGHRTPRKGLPVKALRTERLGRIKTLRLLMSSGMYKGEVTKAALARDWGLSSHTVDAYAEEASRSIQLDAEEGAEELLRRLFAMSQTISADCVERVQNEIDETGRTLVGKKGKMSHQAAAQYYSTALQGIGGMAALLGKNPEAFVSPKQRTGGQGGTPGRQQGPQVVINVIAKRPPPPAAPESVAAETPPPSPPAPAGAVATPPGDKPTSG